MKKTIGRRFKFLRLLKNSMTITNIKNINDINEIIKNNQQKKIIYRGHSEKQETLLPGILRDSKKQDTTEKEASYLEMFAKMGRLSIKPASNFEMLALAQHHGLSTRLLDWTHNLLVAVYFAVEKDSTGNNAEVVALNSDDLSKLPYKEFIDNGTSKILKEFLEQIDNIYEFRPAHITSRITSQFGLFTIHPVSEEINKEFSLKIRRYIIPNCKKEIIKKALEQYGINRYSLFPDLDGLCQYINWKHF